MGGRGRSEYLVGRAERREEWRGMNEETKFEFDVIYMHLVST